MDQRRSDHRKAGEAQPEAVAGVKLPILLANGDQRFGMPEAAVSREAQLRRGQGRACTGDRFGADRDHHRRRRRRKCRHRGGRLDLRRASRAQAQRFRRRRRCSKRRFRTDRSPIVLTHDGPQDKAMVEIGLADDRRFRTIREVDRGRAAQGRARPHADRERPREARRQLRSQPREQHVGHLQGLRLSFGGGGCRPRQDRRGPAGDRRRGRRSFGTSRSAPTSSPARAIRSSTRPTASFATTAIGLARSPKAQSEPERLDRIRKNKATSSSRSPRPTSRSWRRNISSRARSRRSQIVNSKVATTASR